uniref:RNA binding protein n=1 Tax=Solanum tuberosum TaxID=4113 RepID=M0ZI41_SOLTU
MQVLPGQKCRNKATVVRCNTSGISLKRSIKVIFNIYNVICRWVQFRLHQRRSGSRIRSF